MNWDFFSDIYVLNQQDRPDRWKECEAELKRVGMPYYYQFYSIPADPPMKSFCLSQHEILKTFVREGGQTLLDLEDDVVFNSLEPLEKALEQLPQDWDIVYLGCNLRGIIPRPYSENLRIPSSPWMTHAIGYSRKAAEYIAKHYDPLTNQMFDDWLSHNISLFNTFLVAPMVAGQRPGKSDLWGCQTDYTSTIKEGNLLL